MSIKRNINLPHRPDVINIDGRSGQIIKQNESKPRNIEQKPRNRLEKGDSGQTMGTEIKTGGIKEQGTNGLNGIDDALNKAIETAAIKAIESNPNIFQDAVAELIAKKLKDKLKNL